MLYLNFIRVYFSLNFLGCIRSRKTVTGKGDIHDK